MKKEFKVKKKQNYIVYFIQNEQSNKRQQKTTIRNNIYNKKRIFMLYKDLLKFAEI